MLLVSTLCPTRGRPKQCEEMVKSWIDTTFNSELVIFYQRDDPCFNEYTELEKKYQHHNIVWLAGPRYTSGMIWNLMYERHSKAPILHLGSDDIYFFTKGWDQKVHDLAGQYKDEVYCISVREGGEKDMGGKVPRHPIISRKMADTLGYFHPPYFIHYNVDIWLRDITKALGRFVIMKNDVRIGHVRKDATEEHDWRKEFYADQHNNLNDNYIYARDKYTMNHIKRVKKADIEVLRSLIE